MLDYGTLFARSSAGAVGDLEGKNLPHIEKIYKIVNYLHNLSEEERKQIKSLEELLQPLSFFKGENSDVDSKKKNGESSETLEQATMRERKILLNIQ